MSELISNMAHRAALREFAKRYFEAGWLRHHFCGGDEKDWLQHWADRDDAHMIKLIEEYNLMPICGRDLLLIAQKHDRFKKALEEIHNYIGKYGHVKAFTAICDEVQVKAEQALKEEKDE